MHVWVAMKILLAYLSGLPDRTDPYISLLPVGLCSIQAYLQHCGYDAVLANYSGWSEEKIRQHITSCKPLFVGISLWTHNRHASIQLAYQIKKIFPDTILFAGGAHATFQCKYLLEMPDSPFDGVVLGEGEETVRDVSECIKSGGSWKHVSGIAYSLSGKVLTNPPRPYIQHLDSLPYASSCLECSVGVDVEFQAEFILTARGCPSACTFCSSPAFWSRKLRFRSTEAIVGEIEFIRERYGLIYFSFRDDTFTVDRDRSIHLCRLLVEKRLGILWNCQSRVNVLDEELLLWMKRAGCECVQLGVESGSERILRQLGKKITPMQVERASALIKKCGINLSIYLISDVPGETEEDLQATFSLIRTIRPDDGYVSPLAYFPGTSLFEGAVSGKNVQEHIFMTNGDEALFVADKQTNSKRVLKTLSRNRSIKTSNRFRQEKLANGYCYAGNVIAGEWFRQNGEFMAAEAEFKEICRFEEKNPWGWFLLAELYSETGNRSAAKPLYEKVIEIVPKHKPSLENLRLCK